MTALVERQMWHPLGGGAGSLLASKAAGLKTRAGSSVTPLPLNNLGVSIDNRFRASFARLRWQECRRGRQGACAARFG